MTIRIDKQKTILDFVLFFISLLLVVFAGNEINNLPYFGYVLVITSLYMLFKVRKNRLLSYLFLIICMVNISIGINDLIQMGINVSDWQYIKLRTTEYNAITAKSILLFTTILNLFIFGGICKKQDNINEIYNLRIENTVVGYFIFTVLVVILGYGILVEIPKHLGMLYASVGNPIYEYSIELFILAWLCAKNSAILNKFLTFYALLFSVVFLLMGDRSSASMYLIFLVVTNFRGNLTFKKMIVLSFGAIVFFNMIAIYRHTEIITLEELIKQLLDRGLYQDTVSWAYYGSLSIVALSYYFPSRLALLKGFLLSVVGIENEYSSMTLFARNYSSLLENYGGGIFPTHFMAWLQIAGVVFSAVFIGIMIRKFFSNLNELKLFFVFLLIVFGVRWYVYTPIILFRSVFIFGGIVYLVYKIAVHSTTEKSNRISEKNMLLGKERQ